MTLREFLHAQGVPEEEIAAAEEQGADAVQLLAIDRILIPGEQRYTRAELVEQVGFDLDEARRYWRALGFPDTADDDRVFTDSDVEALRTLKALIDQGVVDPEVALQLARVFGQSLSRMADSQMATLRARVEEPLRNAGASEQELAESVTAVTAAILPTIEGFVTYLWRRHVAAAAQRQLFIGAESGHETATVGFADMVGFTAISQQFDEHELAATVDRFENIAYDTVAEHGGRVVKMIGDEVMFVTDDPASGALIAMTLAEVYGDDENLPDVRVGLATGPVLPREGDYFGPAVNRASRIVNIAYAGSAVVSDEVHEALEGDDRFGWKPLRPRRLKGIGWTPMWVLARPGEGSSRTGLPAEVARRMRSRRERRQAKEDEEES
ncbi:MAG: adenylate/guanylate cyclase domain-containing protein [Acidimicrobiia bacterium]|nr:adenylate/guanylate cyclase domain-containing protein [Acidimicrobiia bacterium]MBV8983184.1 adenylate/guanylate cyclase domain-containing protein [Acidimicrobiia bacterium]MBV9040296.1 adenylate/guanylate cyclase domain-containing protein [Acidimicrobiia bacterium]